MATYLNVQRAHRFLSNLKALNARARNVRVSIGELESNYDALSAGDQVEVNAVLQELGYDLADLNSYYTELKDTKVWLDANVTVLPQPGW